MKALRAATSAQPSAAVVGGGGAAFAVTMAITFAYHHLAAVAEPAVAAAAEASNHPPGAQRHTHVHAHTTTTQPSPLSSYTRFLEMLSTARRPPAPPEYPLEPITTLPARARVLQLCWSTHKNLPHQHMRAASAVCFQ